MADGNYGRLDSACYCGACLTGRQTMYCSKSCKMSAFRRARPDLIRGQIERAKAKQNAKQEPRPAFSRVQFNDCRTCGKQWTASKSAKHCSRECAAIEARHRSAEYARARHKAEGKVVRCGRCGCIYCPLYGCKPGGSPVCTSCRGEAKRQYKRETGRNHQARARHYGVERRYFNPLRIFERDQWKCHICGVKTPKRLKGTIKPNAPELDHIVPLSAGGPHTQANVACACRRCNGLKGARPLGQMLLFG